MVKDEQNCFRKIVNIFLPINLNIHFGCSKEPSHSGCSFEYPQHCFGWEIIKLIFDYTIIEGPVDRVYTPYGPRRKKICLWGFANNTDVDQPALLPSLVSVFVIRFLESTICKLATGEISIFYIVSVAEEAVLKLALLETSGTGSVVSKPI